MKFSAVDLPGKIGSANLRATRPAPAADSILRIVILGLSLTSSWGNGHATTYRGLVRELTRRGHQVLFLERDLEWYASNRDLPRPPYCQTRLYRDVKDLKQRFTPQIRRADLVIVGSFVPDGSVIGEWVIANANGPTAFYDIDTPVTLSLLAKGQCEYLTPGLISRYDLYLSFTGGPTLDFLERRYRSRMTRPLYCSVDPLLYFQKELPLKWDLGYMGTYSDDRQPTLDSLLVGPAERWKTGKFCVVGPQYPKGIRWPKNVARVEHLSPARHCAFYNSQRFTLNVTRKDMIRAGYSPSVRLFEAAACGTPIVSDYWPGLECFFEIGREILISESSAQTLSFLKNFPESDRVNLGNKAQNTILSKHTAAHRAAELEQYAFELIKPTIGGA